jgi:hypothetical protein
MSDLHILFVPFIYIHFSFSAVVHADENAHACVICHFDNYWDYYCRHLWCTGRLPSS